MAYHIRIDKKLVGETYINWNWYTLDFMQRWVWSASQAKSFQFGHYFR